MDSTGQSCCIKAVVVILAAYALCEWGEAKTTWVPRVGMRRILRKPHNPYNLKIESPIMVNRKRLLDSKSSEESSELTDDDDSPDTIEEEPDEGFDNGEEELVYRRKAWRDFDDSNAAEEDYNDDYDGPVITLPDPIDVLD